MNLIICKSPLQMYIMYKIIIQNDLKNNVLFLISYNNSDKHKYYYELLKEKCIASYFFRVNENSFFNRLYTLIRLKWLVKKVNSTRQYDSCYISSIDSSYVQMVTSHSNYEKLYTFDDGSINLVIDSVYHQGENASIFKKIFKKILNIKDSIEIYKRKSLCHFTIFKNGKNIIENTRFINLSDGLSRKNKLNNKNEVKIFVGQPLKEINITKNELINIIRRENIEYYFPHPREVDKIDTVKYLITNKIFEDFVVELLINYNSIKIYTFFSTVVLNLSSVDNVCCYAIYKNCIPGKFKSTYDILNSYNIKLLYE